MPGLLQTPSGRFAEAKFVYALVAEFLGVMLFAFVDGLILRAIWLST